MAPLRVFLCFAQEDSALAHKLAQQMHQAGADIWLTDLAAAPPEVVRREFYVRPVFVLLLSKAALAFTPAQQVTQAVVKLFEQNPTRLILPVLAETLDRSALDQWSFLSAFRRLEAEPYAALPEEEMIRQVLEALALTPPSTPIAEWSPERLIEHGKALQAQWRMADALGLFASATQRAPDSFDAWFNLSEALGSRSRCVEALSACERLLALKPADALAWSQRAATLCLLKNFREAHTAVEQALKFDARLPEAWTIKGWALGGLHRYQEGLAACDQAIGLAPYHARAWHVKGYVLRLYNQHPQALVAVDRALSLNPFYTAALVSKAIASMGQGLNAGSQMVAMVDQALQIDPQDVINLGVKAMALATGLKQYRAAMEIADYALSLAPNDAQTWVTKATVLGEAGQYQAALAACDQALKLNPYETLAWYLKGEVYFNQKKLKQAVAMFDAGLQIDPDDENLLNDKGAALQGLGRRREAIAVYDHVLRINPTYELALQNRRQV